MRLTPLDIQNHRFSTRMRGVDAGEVETFLQLIAEDYEALLRERDGLRRQLRELEQRVGELSSNEKILRETLVTAQTLSDDLKKTSLREAEVVVSEAEVRAEKILETAHRRAARLAEDIREMKLVRGRLGTALRSTIQTHLALLDSLSETSEEELEEDKVAYMPPARPARPAPGEA